MKKRKKERKKEKKHIIQKFQTLKNLTLKPWLGTNVEV